MADCSPPSPLVEVLSNLKSHVSCHVCLENFTDPRMLPCQHVFCKKCITASIRCVSQECPICRRKFALSGKGAESFPVAFSVNSLVEDVHQLVQVVEEKYDRVQYKQQIEASLQLVEQKIEEVESGYLKGHETLVLLKTSCEKLKLAVECLQLPGTVYQVFHLVVYNYMLLYEGGDVAIMTMVF